MRRSAIFWIIIFFVLVGLVLTLSFHVFYFTKFHKDFRPFSEVEKNETLKILNENFDLKNYQVRFGNVFIAKNKRLGQVELVNDLSRKRYMIDFDDRRIVKK